VCVISLLFLSLGWLGEFADKEGRGLVRGMEFPSASGAGRVLGWGFGNSCAVFRPLTAGLSGGFADEDGSGPIRNTGFRNASGAGGSIDGGFDDNFAAF
jgi:hypothetical protein